MDDYPHIRIAAAIIRRPDGAVLGGCRAYGEYAGWWEFPGGKLEPDESWEDACRREVAEELGGIRLTSLEHFYDFQFDYPKFRAIIQFFLCTTDEEITEHPDHSEIRWLAPDQLDSVNWLDGDDGILNKIRNLPHA
ncbi:MAG: NUDIX domain-containing protein [Actinomycetes bacterium]|nr:NUDIX domain-containing protein [Actinomycetes bacterium]